MDAILDSMELDILYRSVSTYISMELDFYHAILLCIWHTMLTNPGPNLSFVMDHVHSSSFGICTDLQSSSPRNGKTADIL